MRPFSSILFLVIGICVVSGCGSSKQGVTQIPPEASPALTETHELLVQASYGDVPLNSLNDVDNYAGRFDTAIKAIKSGEIKVIWGKPIMDNVESPQVIAYESKAASGEGYAIKQDGKVHKITSADIPK
jgi:hypothetical protein